MPAIPKTVLLDWFPRAGFHWRRGQGSPRIFRCSTRDGLVQRAIINLHDGEGEGRKVRKRDAQTLVVNALKITTDAINDAQVGIRPDEGIIDFLCRAAEFSELSSSIPEDVWVELVYQIVNARAEYERRTPDAQKRGDRDQLTALAHAADDLRAAAAGHWDWMALEFYVYPHLMGEDVDYEVEDSDDGVESEEDGEEEGRVRVVDAEVERLPGRMGELSIRQDGDGDVQMEG